MKKLFFFAALAFSLLFAAAAYGAQGSLTIIGGPYEGNYYTTDFSIYKIAERDYTFTDDFAGLSIDLSAIDTAEEADTAAEAVSSYISKNSIACMYEKSGDGEVTFSNLDEGYYFFLFNKTENVDMSSFIIGIPYYDSDSGEYYYNVSIHAKITADGSGGGGSGTGETTTESTTEAGNEGGGGGGNDDDDTKSGGGGGGGSSFVIGGEKSDTSDDKKDDTPDPSPTPDDPDVPGELTTEEPPTEIISTTETESEPNTENGVDLPKTGGDKTVLVCNYFGGFFGIAGILILLVNNLRYKFVRKTKE